jgi:hypothetical protein
MDLQESNMNGNQLCKIPYTSLKITVIWHVTLCSLVDRFNVSEESAASILKVDELNRRDLEPTELA